MDVWNHPDFWSKLIGFGVVVALVVIGKLLMRLNERRRPEALRQASLHLGLTFRADDESLLKSFAAFSLFQGRSAKAKNFLRGSSGDREVVLFDAPNWSWNRLGPTVAAFRLSADVPEFSMKPEDPFYRVGEKFGMQKIDSETYQEFSKNYLIQGKREAAIREFFRPQVLRYFTQEKGWVLQGVAGWLLMYGRPGLRVAPQGLSAFLQQTRRIAHYFSEEPATELPSAPWCAEEIQEETIVYKNRGQGKRPSLFEPRAGFFLIALGVFAFIASITEAAWTGGYAGGLISAAFLLSWIGLAHVIRGTALVKYGGGFLMAFVALGIALVFLSVLRSESSEPTPEESTAQQATPY